MEGYKFLRIKMSDLVIRWFLVLYFDWSFVLQRIE